MDDNTTRLVEQLKRNPAMLQNLMHSRDGQMLMQMLTRNDRGAALQQAAQSAVRGDTTQMVQMVQRIMQSPDGAALVERINHAMKK